MPDPGRRRDGADIVVGLVHDDARKCTIPAGGGRAGVARGPRTIGASSDYRIRFLIFARPASRNFTT